MKTFAATCLFCCLFIFSAIANQPVQVSTQLKQVNESYQTVQKELENATKNYRKTGRGAGELRQATIKADSVNSKNQQVIARILDTRGWPSGLSQNENQIIYTVIEQAKKDFAIKYLSLVKEQADKGILLKGDYAMLYDKILMHSRERQLYGTQTITNQAGTQYVWPVSKPDSVNIRRERVGLPSMEDYALVLEQSMEVKLVWDKALNPEDMPALLRNTP